MVSISIPGRARCGLQDLGGHICRSQEVGCADKATVRGIHVALLGPKYHRHYSLHQHAHAMHAHSTPPSF